MAEPLWTVRILTLFPQMFPGPLGQSIAGQALDAGAWALETVDIREFARDKHRSVDDTPFGGGPGMRLSDMFGIGATDKCGPWRVVTHTFESDALERAERLCVTTTFGLWPSSWIEHQEAHRRLDSQLRGLRDLILGRLSPGAKAANKARLSGPAPP